MPSSYVVGPCLLAELCLHSCCSSCLINIKASTADAVFCVREGGVFSFAIVANGLVVVVALDSSLSLANTVSSCGCVEEGVARVFMRRAGAGCFFVDFLFAMVEFLHVQFSTDYTHLRVGMKI